MTLCRLDVCVPGTKRETELGRSKKAEALAREMTERAKVAVRKLLLTWII